MSYSVQAWAHIREPKNRGPLPEANGRGQARYHPCGDVLQLAVRVESGIVVAARFEAKACAPVLAVASLGTELLTGATLEKARALSCLEMDQQLGGLPPSKRHAYLLFLECVHDALSHFGKENFDG